MAGVHAFKAPSPRYAHAESIQTRVFPMTAPDEFRSGLSIRFTRRSDGSISGFALSTQRSRNMRFDRLVSPR
jgi:hypothetical protein